MGVIRHDIDPKGDLLIVLKSPNTLNLMPDPPIEHDSYRPPPPYYRRILVDPSRNDKIEIEFRVSSLQMIRSSAFFERMLGGPWKEAVQEATGSPQLRRVSASDWNTDALTIVLNIIHDRAGEEDVPQDPNTFLLVHIAAIVDYYHCQKCTHIEAAMWQWAQSVTFHPSGDIVNLYIIRVFSWHFYFTYITSRILENSHDLTLININDLPMAELLKMIEKKRQKTMGQLLRRLDVLAAGYQSGRVDLVGRCRLSVCVMIFKHSLDSSARRSLIECTIGEVLNRIHVAAHPGIYGKYDCMVVTMGRRDIKKASFQLLEGMSVGDY